MVIYLIISEFVYLGENGGQNGVPGDNSSVGLGGGKSRRRRTAFTSEQLMELEREFQTKKYLTLSERSHIAQSLSLSEVSINSLNLLNSAPFIKNVNNNNKKCETMSHTSIDFMF